MKPDQQMHDALKDTVRGALAGATQEKLRQATADIHRLQGELEGVKASLEKKCAEHESMEGRLQLALINEARAIERATAAKEALDVATETIMIERVRCCELEKRSDEMDNREPAKSHGWKIEVQKDSADVTRRLILLPIEE